MKKFLSPALLILAAAIWGFAFSAQKAAEAVSPFTLTACRSVIAGLFLIPVIMLFDKLGGKGRKLFQRGKAPNFNKSELIGGILSGVILGTATLFQQFGLSTGGDAGKTAFITALYVVLVPLISLFFGKRAPLNVWISIGISVVGFYLLCITGDFGIALPDLLVLVCALIFSFHILLIDHFAPACDGIRMSCIQFFTSAVMTGVLALLFDPVPDIELLVQNLFPILYLGIASSGIAYTLQILGQKGTPPAVSGILLSLESVFGVLGSAILLGERMSTREYVGCVVIFLAVILSQLDFKKIQPKMFKK